MLCYVHTVRKKTPLDLAYCVQRTVGRVPFGAWCTSVYVEQFGTTHFFLHFASGSTTFRDLVLQSVALVVSSFNFASVVAAVIFRQC